MVTRAELTQLDRETLIVRAEALEIARARTLTRPELVDEILQRSSIDPQSLRLARGFFGLARDLVARVVERGLHLPDAAERIRGVSPPPAPRQAGPAIPTITLADIYVSQGHLPKALETLRALIELEPENDAARARLVTLQAPEFVPLPPVLPEEPAVALTDAPDFDDEAEDQEPHVEALATPLRALDSAPAPIEQVQDTPKSPEPVEDECWAVPHGNGLISIGWRFNAATQLQAPQTHEGGFTLRILTIKVSVTGANAGTVIRDCQDRPVPASGGIHVLHNVDPLSVVRVALGVLKNDQFRAVLTAPLLALSPSHPATLQRWTPKGAIALEPTEAARVAGIAASGHP